MIKAGKLKALATFSKYRLNALPDVPTLMELGYTDIEAVAWQGLVVPSSTPKDVVARLSSELQKTIQSEAVRTQLANIALKLSHPTLPQCRSIGSKKASTGHV
jgi:tripartite-type tricarboxylate transporter receptor subunit TctC